MFFVAFLSWFAFPPLIPDAIKSDLHLSVAQVANSNIVALVATLTIRLFVGPFVDQYGPRKVMAAILIFSAIPSGLAGTVHNASSLYVLRFFIGIVGATSLRHPTRARLGLRPSLTRIVWEPQMLWLEDGVCVLSSRSLSPADAFMRLGNMGLFYHRLGLTILLKSSS